MMLDFDTWVEVKDGDMDAFALISKHYSFRRYADGRRNDPSNPNRRLFVGPGQKMVLVTPSAKAVFCWRFFRNFDRTMVLQCSHFRNEGSDKSSSLILAAERIAMLKWPPQTAFTFVNPKKIRSTNPGYCFLRAGWERKGWTKGGLLILSKQLAMEG